MVRLQPSLRAALAQLFDVICRSNVAVTGMTGWFHSVERLSRLTLAEVLFRSGFYRRGSENQKILPVG